MATPTTRNLTILLTDIKGFTDKTSQRSRADIQKLLDDHRDVVLPVLQGKGGRLIKTIGDAFLMVFDSPTDAVLAGIQAQEALAKHNAAVSEIDRIEIRIAINTGEVNLVEGDVYGEPVNIAARIEGVAEAGEVYFTESVYLSMNKTEVPSAEVGLLQLKGIPEKVRVYKVRRETPLGVGQIPPKAASTVAAGGFPPGEKARLVAAPGGASAAAPAPVTAPIAAGVLPSTWKRAGALIIDAVLCSMILGFFTGHHGGRVRVMKKFHAEVPKPPAAGSITTDDKGVNIVGDGTKLRVDDKGVHGDAGDTKISIDSSGIRIGSNPASKDGVTVYDNKKGTTVAVEEDEDDGDRGSSEGWRRWGFGLVWFVFNLVFLKWRSATPGKLLMKLKVVSLDGAPLTKNQRMMRAAVSVFSGYAAFLGYLWALWEPQKRGWHDLIAGTRVIPAE